MSILFDAPQWRLERSAVVRRKVVNAIHAKSMETETCQRSFFPRMVRKCLMLVVNSYGINLVLVRIANVRIAIVPHLLFKRKPNNHINAFLPKKGLHTVLFLLDASSFVIR
mmetsp:Transcript_16144/g.24138  ORF Transcript_16144/g.24138 Transcript_16144/m.24138 type:complete len:111 (-) Transcript_16144:1039-1371(-)